MANISLLIVRNEGAVAHDLVIKLNRSGFEVAGIAAGGQDAVRMAGQLHPNLVLIEVPSAGAADCVEAADLIRRQYDVPILYLSAGSDLITLERANISPSDCILQPFHERELALRIKLALQEHEAGRQVRRQREWMRVILASIGDAVIATDTEGRITFLNPVAESLCGWNAEAATAQPLGQVFHIISEKTGEPLCDPVAAVLQEGSSLEWTGHAAILTKDGRAFPIEHRAAPIADEAGKVVGAILVFRDAREKRRAEEERARLAAIVESSDDAIVSKTLQSIIVTWNAGAERLFGYRANEIIGQSITVLLPPERIDEEDQILATLRRGQRVDHFETVRVRKDGTRIDVSITISPVKDSDGRIVGASKIARDITGQKRHERAVAEQARLLDLSNDAILVRDTSGRISYWNRGAAETYGYSPAEALGKLSHELLQTVLPESAEHIMEELRRVGRWSGEVMHVRKDGKRVVSMSRWALDRDSEGEPASILETNTDITARKQAEEAVVAAKAAAEKASAVKSQFLANMSHELRTPMNAILGLIDVALPRVVDPLVQDCLLTAKGSADLLLTLLNDLLDSAQIESGAMKLGVAPFSLRQMLDQLMRLLSVRSSEKELSLSCHIPEETPDALLGDRVRLEQVLFNLVGNAIKFTDRGDVTVRVRNLLHGDDAHLEFSVSDTGIGIAPSAQKGLFKPFAQVDSSMSRRLGGTGLGLSICKSLIEMMGGRIWMESNVNCGSTFYFTIRLPLAKSVPPGGETSALPAESAVAPLRVLVAEDNIANQKVAKFILQNRGHIVEIAADGEEALRMIEQKRYDVVLMDAQMPRMNGLQATAAIRRCEGGMRRLPVVAVTAGASREERDRCLAAGMDSYISKPIKAKELIELVESLACGAVNADDRT